MYFHHNIQFRGKGYDSTSEVCKDYGIKYANISNYRKLSNRSKLDIIEDYISRLERRGFYSPVSYKGITYSNVQDLCKALNLDYKRVTKRIYNTTYSLEEIFSRFERGVGEGLVVGDQCFATLKQACEHFDFPYYRVANYSLKSNLSHEEGLNAIVADPSLVRDKLSKEGGIEVTVQGKTFYSIRKACKYFDLPYSKVMNLAYKNNIPSAKALTLIIERPEDFVSHDNPYALTIEGVEYQSGLDACRQLGVSYSNAQNYAFRKGITLAEGITEYYLNGGAGRGHGRHKKPVTVEGVEYSSFNEAAVAYGLDPSYVINHYYHNRGKRAVEPTKGDIILELVRLKEETGASRVSTGTKDLTFRGVTFPSYRAIAKHYGIDYFFIYNHTKKVPFIDNFKKIYLKLEKEGIYDRIDLGNRSYSNLQEACRAVGEDFWATTKPIYLGKTTLQEFINKHFVVSHRKEA